MNPKVLKVMRIDSPHPRGGGVRLRAAGAVLAGLAGFAGALLAGPAAAAGAKLAGVAGPGLAGVARARTAQQARAASPERLSHGAFRNVLLYRPPSGHANALVVFLSGEGGWNATAGEMAEALAQGGALVAGIDERRFVARLERAGGCIAPGSAIEPLSRFIAMQHRLSSHRPPLIAGYSAGATLAYAIAARAPRGAFSGLNLTGTQDRARPAPLAYGFVSRVPGARMVLLPNVDHTFAVPQRWARQLQAAYGTLIRAAAQATSFSTTLPRTCPPSSVRCASATSSSG